MEPISNNTVELTKTITDLNQLVRKNNQRTIRFREDKQAAIEALTGHYAVEFLTEIDFNSQRKTILALERDIDDLSEEISHADTEILKIQQRLSETVKGAESVNDVLMKFFGKDDIRVKVSEDKTFRLMRGDIRAKNLSEGEKTAISFAYFMVKLGENNNKVKDTVVYIDDPISSLDSNHIFNIYSFIKNTFYKFNPSAPKPGKHEILCKQLFISTHNMEFFTLFLDWFRSLGKDRVQYFLIARLNNLKGEYSEIRDCPKSITNFHSEYAYLFSIIEEFRESPTADFDHLYNLPNILRRFVETYLNFKFLSPSKIDEHICLLITDPIKCERARKFMHFYSHSLKTEKFLKLTDFGEIREVVDIVFDAIKAQDRIHYDALVSGRL